MGEKTPVFCVFGSVAGPETEPAAFLLGQPHRRGLIEAAYDGMQNRRFMNICCILQFKCGGGWV